MLRIFLSIVFVFLFLEGYSFEKSQPFLRPEVYFCLSNLTTADNLESAPWRPIDELKDAGRFYGKNAYSTVKLVIPKSPHLPDSLTYISDGQFYEIYRDNLSPTNRIFSYNFDRVPPKRKTDPSPSPATGRQAVFSARPGVLAQLRSSFALPSSPQHPRDSHPD